MIKLNELITAIATIIASKYNFITYINKIGEGFERPSFLIYRISSVQDQLNRFTYNDNILIQIVYFSPWDDHKNADTQDQNNIIETLEKEFVSRMHIKANNLVARIMQTNVDYTGDDDIFLQLTLTITQSKDDVYNDAPANYELMEDIKIKQSEGGN